MLKLMLESLVTSAITLIVLVVAGGLGEKWIALWLERIRSKYVQRIEFRNNMFVKIRDIVIELRHKLSDLDIALQNARGPMDSEAAVNAISEINRCCVEYVRFCQIYPMVEDDMKLGTCIKETKESITEGNSTISALRGRKVLVESMVPIFKDMFDKTEMLLRNIDAYF